MDFTFIIYIIFGILPSLAWLFYYLRKDLHPESKKMILKIFAFGALSTIPVLVIQLSLTKLLSYTNLPQIYTYIIYWFLIIALTEEIFKYLVIKFKVLNNAEFDEPVDAMIYMIIAALGFAAVENMIYLWLPVSAQTISFNDTVLRTLFITFFRFVGATFLHTLCSATIGYFLALSFREAKNGLRFTILGILTAVFLHGLFNFSIMTIGDGWEKVIIPIILLSIIAVFVMHEFDKLKKLKSICKL